MRKKPLLGAAVLALATLPLSGCLIAAGAAAGAVVVDELNERDGKFDPGERIVDGLANRTEEDEKERAKKN